MNGFMDGCLSGLKDVLEKATVDTVRGFYNRWYIPERMVLTIVGDFDDDEEDDDKNAATEAKDPRKISIASVKSLVEKWFVESELQTQEEEEAGDTTTESTGGAVNRRVVLPVVHPS